MTEATRTAPRTVARAADGSALRLLAALLLAIAAVFWAVAATPAAAHDELISSTPADGSQLDAAPAEAVLEFSGNIQEVGTELALQDAQGQPVELPASYELSGMTVTQPLPELTDGAYSLNWRVVSEDGHPISGTIAFTVGEAAAADENVVDGFDHQPVDPDDVHIEGEEEPGAATNPWMVGILSFLGVLVIGGAGLAMFMRSRRQDEFKQAAADADRNRNADRSSDADPSAPDADVR